MVGNLRQVQPDHAARIARFAMDAVQAANNIDVHEDDPSMGRLSIRAGFHSGEVGLFRPYCTLKCHPFTPAASMACFCRCCWAHQNPVCKAPPMDLMAYGQTESTCRHHCITQAVALCPVKSARFTNTTGDACRHETPTGHLRMGPAYLQPVAM